MFNRTHAFHTGGAGFENKLAFWRQVKTQPCISHNSAEYSVSEAGDFDHTSLVKITGVLLLSTTC